MQPLDAAWLPTGKEEEDDDKPDGKQPGYTNSTCE